MINVCALATSGKATLTNSIGKNKISETVLTNTEFCWRLTELRDSGYLIYTKYKLGLI